MGFKRCHWYDDDGAPRLCRDGTLGCRRGRDCVFVHPNDPRWRTADKVGLPPRHLLGDSYDGLTRTSSGPRHSSPPRPSPSRGRRTPPPLSTAPPREAFRPRTPPHPKASTPPPPPPPPHTPTAPAIETTRDPRSRVRGGPEPSTSPAPRSSMPPPPPLLKSSPLSHGSTQTSQQQPSHSTSKEASREEKMNTWVDRIKIISDAVLARAEYLRLEKEIQGFQRLVQTWRNVDVPEDKTRLTTQLSSLEAQFDLKKKELNSLTRRLIDADFWPALPQNVALGMWGTVEDLQDQVKDISISIRRIEALRMSSSNTVSASPPKEMLPTEEANRPTKRRRLETGDVTVDSETNGATQEVVRDVPLGGDLDNLRERILTLENQLSEMQNELVQYDHNLLLSLEDDMEARFEQYGLKSGGSILPRPTPADPPGPAVTQDPQKITSLENGLQKAGEDITLLAQEVGQLITINIARDRNTLSLQTENDRLQLQITALQEVQMQNQKTLEAQKAEIDALKAAVTVYISQKRPEQHATPSMDDIIVSCRPSLIDAIRQDIKPLLEEMKAAVETMLQTQNTQLCNVVLSKLSTTLTTVETIAKWMNSVKDIRTFNSVNGMPPQKLADKSAAG